MIQPPKWARDAQPTLNGWMKKGELLLARKHTQAQVDEWFAAKVKKVEPIEEIDKPVIADYEEVKVERKKKTLKRLFNR